MFDRNVRWCILMSGDVYLPDILFNGDDRLPQSYFRSYGWILRVDINRRSCDIVRYGWNMMCFRFITCAMQLCCQGYATHRSVKIGKGLCLQWKLANPATEVQWPSSKKARELSPAMAKSKRWWMFLDPPFLGFMGQLWFMEDTTMVNRSINQLKHFTNYFGYKNGWYIP